MASVEETDTAIATLTRQLAERSAAAQGTAAGRLDRTVSVTVTDLDRTYTGRLHAGAFDEITTEPSPRAKIRLSLSSDDLLQLAAGTLAFAPAWSSGRISLQAGFSDLLALRSLL